MKPAKVPAMTTDAEAFLDQDLSDLDFSQFRPVDRERGPKTARINMRVPQPLLDALKAKAAAQGIPYQRLIRDILERGLR